MRGAIDERDDESAYEWLERECALDRAGAEQAVAYVRAGKAILGTSFRPIAPSSRSVFSTKAGACS